MRSVAITKSSPAPDPRRPLGGVLQRKCACGQHATGGECEECGKKKRELQRRKGAYAEPGGVPAVVHEVLRSPGHPLDTPTRAFMDARFGHDFSDVRLHTDTKAAESARGINALAYTVGQNIVFGAGQYAPWKVEGKKLIAHELTHVVQQGSTIVKGSLQIGPESDAYERDAERSASILGSGSVPRAFQQDQPGPLQLLSAPCPPREWARVQRKPIAKGALAQSAMGAGNPIGEFWKTWGKGIEEARRMLLEQRYGCFCGPGKVCEKPVNAIDECCQTHDHAYDLTKINTPDGVSMWECEGLKRSLVPDLALALCLGKTFFDPHFYGDVATAYRVAAMDIFGELRPAMAAWCKVQDIGRP